MDELEDESENNQEVDAAVPALPMDLKHVPFEFSRISPEESLKKSKEFLEMMAKRRTVRFFSSDPVPIEILKNIIMTAGKFYLFSLILIKLL